MTFGERLRAFRKQANLTQKGLGEKAGLAEINISQYERGIYTPKPEAGKKIANALGVTLADLYGWTELDSDHQHIEQLSAGVKLLELAEKADPLTYDLLTRFDQLNDSGKGKTISYVDGLLDSSEYTK